MIALAHVVWSCIHSENQAIILMFEFVLDQVKNDMSIPNIEHFLHVQVNWWCTFFPWLLYVVFEDSCFSESILHICVSIDKTPCEWLVHLI